MKKISFGARAPSVSLILKYYSMLCSTMSARSTAFVAEMSRGMPSQFVRSRNPDCYTYIEYGKKNRSGGLAQLNVDNKRVPGFATPENEPCCIVFLLDRYLEKLP